MADQAYIAIAAQYATEDEAVADFEKIHDHYKSADKHGSFDAAVIKRDVDGTLTMPKRDDDGKHRGVGKGLAIGLAGGLAVALFPAVALGGALVVAGGSGAGIGALAGHIARKTPSKDLQAISETLDAGSAGVVLVVDPAESDIVQGLLTNATRVTVKDLSVDDEELDTEVDEAYE